MFGNILGCILLFIIGAVMAFWPKLIYAIREGWKNEGSSEPSKDYLRITRGFGVLLMALAIILLIDVL